MESGLEEIVLDPGELDLAREYLEMDMEDSKNPKHRCFLRNALNLALAISPLCLLMPIQILKTRIGRKSLLNVSWHSLCVKAYFLTIQFLDVPLSWKREVSSPGES
jgi:hypothetical protein